MYRGWLFYSFYIFFFLVLKLFLFGQHFRSLFRSGRWITARFFEIRVGIIPCNVTCCAHNVRYCYSNNCFSLNCDSNWSNTPWVCILMFTRRYFLWILFLSLIFSVRLLVLVYPSNVNVRNYFKLLLLAKRILWISLQHRKVLWKRAQVCQSAFLKDSFCVKKENSGERQEAIISPSFGLSVHCLFLHLSKYWKDSLVDTCHLWSASPWSRGSVSYTQCLQ